MKKSALKNIRWFTGFDGLSSAFDSVKGDKLDVKYKFIKTSTN